MLGLVGPNPTTETVENWDDDLTNSDRTAAAGNSCEKSADKKEKPAHSQAHKWFLHIEVPIKQFSPSTFDSS